MISEFVGLRWRRRWNKWNLSFWVAREALLAFEAYGIYGLGRDMDEGISACARASLLGLPNVFSYVYLSWSFSI